MSTLYKYNDILEKLVFLGILEWFKKERNVEEDTALLILTGTIEYHRQREFYYTCTNFLNKKYKFKLYTYFSKISGWSVRVVLEPNSPVYKTISEYFLKPVVEDYEDEEDARTDALLIITKKLILHVEPSCAVSIPHGKRR
jgi:hypothetical protein